MTRFFRMYPESKKKKKEEKEIQTQISVTMESIGFERWTAGSPILKKETLTLHY